MPRPNIQRQRAVPAPGCGSKGFPVSYTLELFHRDPVGTRRTGGKGGVEVECEPRVLGEGIVRDLDDTHLVVAFIVNDARGVLVEEVVRDHQAIVVAAQDQVVWSGVRAEAD